MHQGCSYFGRPYQESYARNVVINAKINTLFVFLKRYLLFLENVDSAREISNNRRHHQSETHLMLLISSKRFPE